MTDQQPPQHRALCLVCGRLATSETAWINDAGVTEAAFLCELGHSWTSKWYVPKGEAA